MLVNKIWQFGNHIELKDRIDQKKLLEEIKQFDNDWHQYNVFKPEIKRFGLDIINESENYTKLFDDHIFQRGPPEPLS